MTTDERHGMPSASGMYRLENCPASFRMEQGVKGETSASAEKGTDLHAKLETGEDGETVSDDWVLETARRQIEELEADWIQAQLREDVKPMVQTHVERRLAMTQMGGVVWTEDHDGPFIFTGKPDRISVLYTRALVVDFKSLWGDHAAAEQNAQLRNLAVLVARKFRCTDVRVAIVQPRKGKPTVADFDAEGLSNAYNVLRFVLQAAEHATLANRKAGNWCQHCKAKAHCDVFHDKALTHVKPLTIDLPSDPSVAKKAMLDKALGLRPDELVNLYDHLKYAEWYVAAIKTAARLKVLSGEMEGLMELQPGVEREKITDLGLVWTRMQKMGVSADEFAAASTMTKKAVEPLVKKATGKKGKELKDAIKAALDGATT